jgi:hypothetical protein
MKSVCPGFRLADFLESPQRDGVFGGAPESRTSVRGKKSFDQTFVA